MSITKVKNLNGTTGRVPANYDSWIDFWESKTNEKAKICSNNDCKISGRNNLLGAHVKTTGNFDNSWYIVPLCHSCNKIKDDFFVVNSLVPIR